MTLHVERLGAGPDLVLLHGWGTHGGVWRSLAARLAGSFRLHLVDLPGHGHSGGHPFESLESVVDEVAECTPRGARCCGWSLGGLVALRLAARHPSRLSALALVSTTPCFAQRPDWPHAVAARTLAQFAAGLGADPAKTIRAFVYLNARGESRARDRMRELAAMLVERATPSPPSLAAGLAVLLDTDLRDQAGLIGLPATVIHGGRDGLAPIQAGRWLARQLPFGRLVEIPRAAHLPFVSHGEAVARALKVAHG